MDKEKDLILEVRPSWWNYFWYLLFFWLIVPFLIVMWKRADLKLKIYTDRVVLERGVMSKNVTEVFMSDIRTINLSQSFLQRIFHVGDIAIASAGVSGWEQVAKGLPNPQKIREIITEKRSKFKNTDE